jgi:hypothetical protein
MQIESRFDDASSPHDFTIFDTPWTMHPTYSMRTERFGGGYRGVMYCNLNYVQAVALVDLLDKKITEFNKKRKEELDILARAEDAKKKALAATVKQPADAKIVQGSGGAA